MFNPRTNHEANGPANRFWPRFAVAAFVIVLGLAVCTGTAFSQDAQGQQGPPPQGSDMGGQMGGPGGHHQMPSVDDQLKHMTKKLNLTDEQQPKVKAILDDQHAKMEALHNDSSVEMQDKFVKMREIHENSSTQIKALLTPDQQKKFDEMQKEHHDHMGHQDPPPPSN
jgi:Spy/CpxP family protein refolding chaperone